MDPTSAIGVVGTVFQFYDIVEKIVTTYQEVRGGASTNYNRNLEDDVRSAQAVREKLRDRNSNVPESIRDVANKCAQSAGDLLELLEHIRGIQRKKKIWRVAFLSIWWRKDIERLERTWKDKQVNMDQLLTQDMW